MTLSWTFYLFKECITWDTLCRTEGLPQEKVLRGYIRISLFLSCYYEFPPIMSPFYAAVQWKIPEHKEQMPLFALDCGANADCWVYSDPMLFLFEFWSIWSLLKSMIIHFWNTIFLWDQQAHAAVALTQGRRAEVTEWWGKKIKVAAPWLLWKNLTF